MRNGYRRPGRVSVNGAYVNDSSGGGGDPGGAACGCCLIAFIALITVGGKIMRSIGDVLFN